LREDAAAGDTMRYKQSGAARAYLFCGDAEAGRAALLDVLNTAGHWIVETTSAARLIPHDLALLVAAPSGRAAKGAAGFPPHIRVGLSDAGLADLVRQHWKA